MHYYNLLHRALQHALQRAWHRAWHRARHSGHHLAASRPPLLHATDAPVLSAEAEEELTRAALDGLDDEVSKEEQGEEGEQGKEEEEEAEEERRGHGEGAGGEVVATETATRMAVEKASSKRASVEKELRDLQAQIREIKANGLDGTAAEAKPAGDAGGLWRLAAVGGSVAIGIVAVTLAAVRST